MRRKSIQSATMVVALGALVAVLVVVAGCGAATARQSTPTPATVAYASLGQIAQLNTQSLDPSSAFAQHAQSQLQAIGQHAGRPLSFAQGYDYTNADTDGNPTTHEGYYVTLGIFADGQQPYLAVGAVTADGVRTPLIWSLANWSAVVTIQQDAAGTYPAAPNPARVTLAGLMAFLGTPGQVVGLDLTASSYAPGVLPIIGALEGKQPLAGLAPFQLSAPGQTMNGADYPTPTTVSTFPPYSTLPASALATPTAG